MNIHELLVSALVQADGERARSQQVEIGPSQIGGCRAAVWLAAHGAEKVNPTTKLPAIMGTAIHTQIEEAIKRLDPFGEDLRTEITVGHVGLAIRGHIDLYIKSAKAIVDWKTTKISNLAYFPSEKQRWQVHLYGYLLNKPDTPVETVTLVAIPRDGDETDIKVHTEPYDEAIALQAIDWLLDLREREEQPAPERDAVSWCKRFCSYYGGACFGRSKETGCVCGASRTSAERFESGNTPSLEGNARDDENGAQNASLCVCGALDDETSALATRYHDLGVAIRALESEQKSLREGLEGRAGVGANGVSIAWSEVAGRTSIDEDAVLKALGYVPKKQGSPSLRLTVKRA